MMTFQKHSVKLLIISKIDLPHHDMLSIEYGMWVRKWRCSDEVPTMLVDALKSCDEIQFPNIFVLLKLTLINASSHHLRV